MYDSHCIPLEFTIDGKLVKIEIRVYTQNRTSATYIVEEAIRKLIQDKVDEI